MTLYTKKKGEFIPLTKEQVRRIRRTEQILTLQKQAWHMAVVLRAHADWLKGVERQSNTLRAGDIKVANLPNQERMRNMAKMAMDHVREMRKS